MRRSLGQHNEGRCKLAQDYLKDYLLIRNNKMLQKKFRRYNKCQVL
jgi:hypothetical protein